MLIICVYRYYKEQAHFFFIKDCAIIDIMHIYRAELKLEPQLLIYAIATHIHMLQGVYSLHSMQSPGSKETRAHQTLSTQLPTTY